MTVHVTPAVLDAAAGEVARAGGELRAQATALEGRCESVPKVGDVQAGLAFGQAHYDWAQTRFEDLTVSAEELVDVAKLLESSAAAFAGQDQRTQQVLNSIVTALGTHPGGEHP